MINHKMPPNIIVIDGPRGAGKSTTARNVVKRLNDHGVSAIYFKKTGHKYNEIDYMRELISTWYSYSPAVVVVDRLIASEWVHTILGQRVENFTEFTHRCAELCLDLNQFTLGHFILLADKDVIVRRIELRGDQDHQLDQPIDTIEPMWIAAHSLLPSSELVYVNTTDVLDQLTDTIVWHVLSVRGVKYAPSF